MLLLALVLGGVVWIALLLGVWALCRCAARGDRAPAPELEVRRERDQPSGAEVTAKSAASDGGGDREAAGAR